MIFQSTLVRVCKESYGICIYRVMLCSTDLALFYFYNGLFISLALYDNAVSLFLAARPHTIVARVVVMLKVNESPSARLISDP